MKNYKIGQEPEETTIGTLFDDGKYQTQNVVLELIKICEDKTMMVVKQIAIHNAYKVSIAFSPNGEYFSLFRKKLNILQVFKIENGDISGLMDKVHDEKCIISIKSASEFKFAQKM